jgi:hypothetical protein
MPNSSVAYLILAHNEPAHLSRLIRMLDGEGSDFYVHVDAKSDISSFAPLFGLPRVTFLRSREKVFWGGFSQVGATLRLLRAAAPGNYGRYSLLSGCDFPIKPGPAIRDTLLGSDTEFLRVDRRLDERPRNGHAFYIERHHLNDWEIFNPRVARRYRERRGTPWLWNAARTAAHAIGRSAFVAVGLALPRRRYPGGMTPYQGSTWWALTAQCVNYVFDFLSRTPEYTRFHKSVGMVDEVFFHSIIKGSPFATRISHDFEVAPLDHNESGAHYIDWRTKGVPLPKTLDETDFPALLASPALFARKFDQSKSSRLLSLIQERLCLQPEVEPPR